MSTLFPLIVTALSLVQAQEADDKPTFDFEAEGPVAMVAFADSLPTSTTPVAVMDLVGAEGSSRRVLLSLGPDSTPVDILDGGSWGESGFLDYHYYITDRRGDTMTAIFEVDNADPAVSMAPEGGDLIELRDRITMSVLNHDLAETTRYILRDNQITYRLDQSGSFVLTSIRPKPNDLDSVVSTLRIYDADDKLLDAEAFASSLRHLFPLPGKRQPVNH